MPRGAAPPTASRSVSVSLRRRTSLAFLLVPPMAWLVLAYLGSLAVLLVSAFWSTNAFTGAVVHSFTLDNVVRVLTDEVFRTATVRTVAVALAVTVICAVLAVPLAYYMAKMASPRMRLALVVAVMTPLWASYLVKAYAWRMLLSTARKEFDDGRHLATSLSYNSGREWSIVQGLELDDFSRQKVDASVAELVEERDTVQQLGLLGS